MAGVCLHTYLVHSTYVILVTRATKDRKIVNPAVCPSRRFNFRGRPQYIKNASHWDSVLHICVSAHMSKHLLAPMIHIFLTRKWRCVSQMCDVFDCVHQTLVGQAPQNPYIRTSPKLLIDWFIITLPLRLSASGRRINIIMLANDTSFRPCSVSLYLSLPRKLIGPLDPSSPVRLMAVTWSLPDRGWWRRWDCF